MTHVQWATLIDSLLEAVWVVDPHTCQVLAANLAACQMMQRDRHTLIGTSVLSLTSSPEDQLFWQSLDVQHFCELHSHTHLQRSDGQLVTVERRVTLVNWPDQDPVCLVALWDHSEQLRTQQRLEELLAEMRATLESTADALLVCDLNGNIRAFNRLFATLWQLPDEWLTHKDDEAIHNHLIGVLLDTETYQQRLVQLQRSPMLEATDVLVLRSGRIVERIAKPQLARGRPIGRVYVFRDITDSTATAAKLRLAAKVFESSLDAIFITDPDLRIVVCNPAAGRMAQCDPSEFVEQHTQALFFSPTQSHWLDDLQARLLQDGFWEGELWYRQAGGAATALQASWVVLKDRDGARMNTVLFVKDLSEKMAAQQRIEQLAYSDVLTGLPNRLMMTERVTHAIHLAERSQQSFAVMFLDLDRFKSINDSLGHLFGDMVLIEVAARLKNCLRQTDTLCRLGGDEFVIHLHDADREAAEITAQRIIDSIIKPVSIDDLSFNLSCSVGIAMYPSDATTLDELIQHADTAMYQVKDRGKGHYRFYRPQMNADLLSRIQLDHAMREGLEREEFVLHYQPRANVRTGELHTCEALVRWNHPQKGMVPPGTFITVAEETGFIVPLGQWVLREAVRQSAEWAAAGHPCQVAVNVSAMQFQQADFVSEVAELLKTHALPPALLELELTESILIHDANEALERLRALADLGVELALDDFGTGYSSLTYLKRFSLHKLKVDRSFIMTLHELETDAAIVAAIIQMGHAMKMSVVAEGVELEAQRDKLCELGCDDYQGFLYSPAVPPAAFLVLLIEAAKRHQDPTQS